MRLIRRLLDSTFRWLATLLAALLSLLKSRATLQLENIALRHQLAVLQRSAKKRPRMVKKLKTGGVNPRLEKMQAG